MSYTVLFICFIAVNLLAMMIGRLPEVIQLPEYLNFKPFNCRLCLSTHACWVLHTLVALLTNSWLYFISGIAAAICIYYLISKEEKKQWE